MLRIPRSLGLLGAVCAALAVPLPAAADIFRFVDRNGVEHYTNIQPSGRGWQRIYKNKSAATDREVTPRMRVPESIRSFRDPDRYTRYDAHIREAATLYQLPETFLRAVMRVESDFQPYAVSGDGAMGLMQLMPGTAKSMGVIDPYEPRQNVLGGARFLRVLANKFGGDLILTVAAYNAGHGAVERYRGVPPYAETRRYVERVLRHYYTNLAAEGAAQRLARR
ncbi:MAG: lytic transglycosylase catalytic subunit [Alphaproteobacteria bacterium]|nr:MAG: lytic transglycosylase catalytic subunit [Alphaproteobacteria bacterium]